MIQLVNIHEIDFDKVKTVQDVIEILRCTQFAALDDGSDRFATCGNFIKMIQFPPRVTDPYRQ